MPKGLQLINLFSRNKVLDLGQQLVLPFLSLFGLASSLIFTMIFARVFGASDFGLYAQVIAWGNILSVVAGFGLPVHLFVCLSKMNDQEILSKFFNFRSHFAAQLCTIAVTVMIFIALFEYLVPDGYYLKNFLWVILIFFVFQCFARLSENSLIADGRALTAMLQMTVFPPYLQLMATFLVIFIIGDAVETVILSLAACYGIYFLLEFSRRYSTSSSIIGQNRVNSIPQILKSAFPYFILGGVLTVNTNIDLIMLGMITNDTNAGIYRVALGFSGSMNIVIIALGAGISKQIGQGVAKKNYRFLEIHLKKTARLSFALCLCAQIIFVFFGELIICLTFGLNFITAHTSLLILSTSVLLISSFGAVGRLSTVMELKRELVISSLVMLITNILLNMILIPILSINGAAIATAATMLSWHIWLFFLIYKTTKMRCAIF